MKNLIVSLFTITVISCSTVTTKDTYKLTYGMNESEVKELLGEPDSNRHGVYLYYLRIDGDMWGSKIPYFVYFQDGMIKSFGSDQPSLREYLYQRERRQQIGSALIETSRAIRDSSPKLEPMPWSGQE